MEKTDMPVQYLKGVGPRRAKVLKQLGVETLGELFSYFPFRYEDRTHLKTIRQIEDNEENTIYGIVVKHQLVPTRGKKALLRITLEDGTGKAVMVCFNQMYLVESLPPGTEVIVHGKFSLEKGIPNITNFTYEKITSADDEDLIHTKRIVPVYQVTAGLPLRFLRALIKKALDSYRTYFQETLSQNIIRKYALAGFGEASYNIHFPPDFETLAHSRRRMIFEEFFFWELAMALRKKRIKAVAKGRKYEIKKTLLTPFKESLPFVFTTAQKRVINEIFSDMQSEKPMNRLLEGDVGSGKTVVAASALLLAVENGYQGAIMAPTEILAEQHYMTLSRLLSQLGVAIELVIGKQSPAARAEVKGRIREGKSHIVIGTHALLEEDMKFHNLALIVIDEQHKFGVMQRAKLREKGKELDVLVMTATPIPRTLALTAYGDLDSSVIDEMPPGRKPVQTRWMSDGESYGFVIDEVRKNRQAYIVYPLVNESDKLELKSAIEMLEKLKNTVFKNFSVGLLHGQMKTKEKEDIMRKFLSREISILITTIIIEVGIDVSNAGTMVIEHADRFGLATLHQLRGRVGRSDEQSYCILLGKPHTEEAKRRMEVMLSTNDGFKIAEEDLRIRGSGEFFGTEQHGLPEFRIGDIIGDYDILKQARHAAFELVEKDADLVLPENKTIKNKFIERYARKFPLLSVG